MTNNEHNFIDQLLRDQVEEAQIPFKEAYWTDMAAKLDERDKGKKKFFLWRGLSILAVLLTVGISAYLFPKLKNKPTPQTQTIPNKTQTSHSLSS